MDWNEDELLADELAALAGMVGANERVMRLVAKAMRKNSHEVDMVVPLPAEEALDHVVRVLGRAGRHVESALAEDLADWSTVRVVASSGTGGLNSVVVTALVAKSGETETEVRLRAATLEGLIKQRAGERTAVHLAAVHLAAALGK
ncbi:hypothetical protein [Streptomyces regalis]|uniref:hypothetical protein n=1 Tax=Streptomyces regalis TaxID=68262 RepID=UPI001ABF4AA8|nr:hypothetical protein [Streptomyces regalis]